MYVYVALSYYEKSLIFSPGETERFHKPVLVLVNPASGKGHAARLFKEKIAPMFQESYVGYEVIETGIFFDHVHVHHPSSL